MYPEKMSNLYRGDDVTNRINGTFIRYKGVPYYAVTEAKNTLGLYAIPIDQRSKSAMTHVVSVEDDDLDISSIELGYMNEENETGRSDVVLKTLYAYRNPSRQGYRQGIWEGNVRFESLDGKPVHYTLSHYSVGIANLLKNNYPSFDEAMERLAKYGEVALSREVGISQDKLGVRKIFYRGEQIGYGTPSDPQIYLRSSPASWIFRKNLSVFPWKVAA